MDERTILEDLGFVKSNIKSDTIKINDLKYTESQVINVDNIEPEVKRINDGDLESQYVEVDNIKDVHIFRPIPQSSEDYNVLKNKPSINGVVLKGDKTARELGIEAGDANYVHKQTESSDEWIIVHQLNKYPSVSVMDSAGDEVEGNVHYDTLNRITITFKGAFKGTATLN